MKKFFLCTMVALAVALGASGCGGPGRQGGAELKTEAQSSGTETTEAQKEETTVEETTAEETTVEETTAEETTAEAAPAAKVPNTVFQTGTWDGLVFTNPWLNLQIAFPEGTHIASEEEIEATVGAGAEVIVNDGLYTQEQMDVSNALSIYDFMVTLPDQVSNIQLMYENTVLAGEADISAADYLDIISQQLVSLESMQYEILESGQAVIAGEEYEYLDLTALGGTLGQSYFCRRKDSYIVSLIVTYIESSFQDVVDILNGAVAVN